MHGQVFFERENKNLKNISKIANFVKNLPKTMEKVKKIQKMILIMIEICP